MPQLYHLLKMISQGDIALARQELTSILKTEPGNTEAWSLMALAVAEPEQKAYCYRQVLKYDPANENARQQLARLEAQPAAPASPPAAAIPAAPAPQYTAPAAPFPVGPPVPLRNETQSSSPAATPRLAAPGVPGLIPPDPAPEPTQEWLTQPAAAPAAAPAVRRDYPAETFEQISNGRPQKALKESCSQQILYTIAGLGIIGITQLILFILSAAAGVDIIGDSGQYPQTAFGVGAYCLIGLLAFFDLGLWIYLGVAGWDYELSDFIKGPIVFVAILTPLGWYWVGRGAVRLTRVWLSGEEKKADPAKASPPA